MTLDELIAEMPGLRLRLRNLFQTSTGWTANVCESQEDVGYEFGRGATPVEALLAAFKAAGVKVE